jgi:DNA-directed RNA polymerase specialized sigma subunit
MRPKIFKSVAYLMILCSNLRHLNRKEVNDLQNDQLQTRKKNFLNAYSLLHSSVQICLQLMQMIETEHEICSETAKNLSLPLKIRHGTKNLLKTLTLLIDEKNSLCSNILSKINQMENETEKNILILKYIKKHTWEEICEIMNYSLRQTYNLHNRALKHFNLNDTWD